MREGENMWQWVSPAKRPVVAVLVVGFLCALGWAKARDPFMRERFSVRFGAGERVKAVAVLAKPVSRRPVVVYLQDAGTDLEGTGVRLRQLAELGVAAVGMDYNQTNQTVFSRQFSALLEQVSTESWADTNLVAWFGYGVGAQRMLRFARWHPQPRPQLLICLAGGQAADLFGRVKAGRLEAKGSGAQPGAEEMARAAFTRCRVAMIRGQEDAVFPVKECEEFAAVLRSQGLVVDLCILEGQQHNFGENQDAVLRLVAEYTALHLGRDLRRSPVCGWSQWLWWSPLAAVLAAVTWAGCRRIWPSLVANRPQTWLAKGFTAFAVCVGVAAGGDLALRLVLPSCPISRPVRSIARWWLLAPEWRASFDQLAGDAGWNGRPLRQLLQHAELASLQRKQFYTNLDERMYQQFVLPPRMGETGAEEWGWRRTLWETFYPRIRNQHDPGEGARTVVRFLRERVAILPAQASLIRRERGASASGSAGERLAPLPEGAETCWREGAASEAGFEGLYVAAMRSVGIAARLDQQGKAEYWSGTQWTAAPEPFQWEGLVFR